MALSGRGVGAGASVVAAGSLQLWLLGKVIADRLRCLRATPDAATAAPGSGGGSRCGRSGGWAAVPAAVEALPGLAGRHVNTAVQRQLLQLQTTRTATHVSDDFEKFLKCPLDVLARITLDRLFGWAINPEVFIPPPSQVVRVLAERDFQEKQESYALPDNIFSLS